jgi:hypothetical protein
MFRADTIFTFPCIGACMKRFSSWSSAAQMASPVTLKSSFEKEGDLERVGGT